jgi:hypothetical protein
MEVEIKFLAKPIQGAFLNFFSSILMRACTVAPDVTQRPNRLSVNLTLADPFSGINWLDGRAISRIGGLRQQEFRGCY